MIVSKAALASPKDNPNFDQEYENNVKLKVELIQQLSTNNVAAVTETNKVDISKATCSLKNGKAAHKQGITAEHLKHAEQEITPPRNLPH